MAFEGMDTDVAQGQASRLQSQGVDAVESLIAQVNGLISEIEGNWKGPDASAFQSEWNGQLQPALTNVHQALDQFHTLFTMNITQQINASAATAA